MNAISSLVSTGALAVRRAWNYRILMLGLLAGLVVAVALLSSIPMYADAVYHRLLQGELTEVGTHRPPFAFMWRYIGAWHGEVSWEEYQPIDQYLAGTATANTGLPLALEARHVQTAKLQLFPADDSGAFSQRDPLLWTGLGFISGLKDHVSLVAGSYPGGDAAAPGEDTPVVVSHMLAQRMGLQVGERFVLFRPDGAGPAGNVQIPVVVAGIWQPVISNGAGPGEGGDPYWFYQPDSFEEMLLTSEEAFVGQIVPAFEASHEADPVALAVWYQVFDGSQVRSGTVPDLLGGITRSEARANALLANTTLDVSPAAALEAYRQSARTLMVMLTVFAVPLVGLVLYFVVLIAGMVVQRGQTEVALWRSRGTTRLQVLLVYLLEGLLVGGLGLAGGLLLGSWLARIMTQAQTFLDPALIIGTARLPVPVVVSELALAYGLLAVGLVLLALLLPALGSSRYTIVTFKWERARALAQPLWQRYYLDLGLVALMLYGGYVLRQQGTIASLSAGGDPFSNPLLFLMPALFCFALALFFLRLFPFLMRLLAWLAALLPGTTLLLTMRQLARSAGQYTGPLLLLSLTLSLAIFTASMAATLDRHLSDQIYYQFGADLNLAETGESTEAPDQSSLLSQPVVAPSSDDEEEGPRWLFLPVGEHLRVPGVLAAARVGDYGATSNIGGRQQTGRLLGVDRTEFPAVAYYRLDFGSGEPLAGLMNRLAVNPANLLVSHGFLADHGLNVGDPLRLTVGAAGTYQEIEFLVAAPLDLFPTLYPQDGPFFVANLDYVHQQMGGTFPYSVWLASEPGAQGIEVAAGVRGLGLAVAAVSDARETIAAEQNRPERQGLFGLLTVGFLAAAVLTVLGFLVYAVVSFQRRFIELGMLRAVGLSTSQMGVYLAGEQALLILAAGGLGTVLGIVASYLFIPYFQVGGEKTAQVPPFVVQIAWGDLWTIYALFGIMFVAAVAVLIALLVRMRIFEAVKMGEAG